MTPKSAAPSDRARTAFTTIDTGVVMNCEKTSASMLRATRAPARAGAPPSATGVGPVPALTPGIAPEPSSRVPAPRLARVQLRGRRGLALQQASPLVAAQEAAELGVAVTRVPPDHALEVALQHRQAADQKRRTGHAVERAGQHVRGRGAHEVLAEAVPDPAGPPVLVAGPHRAQVNEPELGIVPGHGDPSELAAAMAVDAVPHQLAHEPADLAEAGRAVELGHPDRVLVPRLLRDEIREIRQREPHFRVGLPEPDEVRLARASPYPRVALHPVHQAREVAGREVEIEVNLSDLLECSRIDRVVAAVERIDHASAQLALAAIRAAQHADPGKSCGVLGEDPRRSVFRAVVDDQPERRRRRLARHGVERAPSVLLLVPAGRNQAVAARAHRCTPWRTHQRTRT